MSKNVFFIALRQKGELFSGLKVVTDPADLKKDKTTKPPAKPKPKKPDTEEKAPVTAFRTVIVDFIRSMESYRKFMPMTVNVAPAVSYQIASKEIEAFAKAKGRARPDLKGEDYAVYELGTESYPEFQIKRSKVRAVRGGAKHLPEVVLIGLISVYDMYFSSLLRAAAGKEAKVFLTDDKSIRLSELNSFNSVDDIKEALIQRELDSILRSSLTDQLDWCQRHFRFDPPLKSYLPHWADFVEICERRNLFAHTGGIVSAQYLQNCEKAKANTSAQIGQHIEVDSKYFARAVDIVCETGMKLGYIFWRTFSKSEAEAADEELNSFCFDLILEQNFGLAADLLKFAVESKRKPASEELRRMFLVNYANCLRLRDKQQEADAILDKEDWTACSAKFRVSVAAVKNDVDGVIKMMKTIGAKGEIGADEYRGWPVFARLQTDKRFQAAFEKIFSEPLIRFEVSATPEEIKPVANEVGTKRKPKRQSRKLH